VRKFEDVQYVQLLLHPTERKLAIRPCSATDAHRIRWRGDPGKPITTKTICCPHFGTALFQIMNWNPDYLYHIRGSWAARARDEIIVFTLSNAVPAAIMETVSDEDEETVRRRVDMCPEEWSDTFGDDFYDYALDNSFYFLAPKTEWKADSKGVDVPGTQQLMIKTEEDLGNSMEILKYKVNNSDGQ
jgi:hypothetical protein